MVFIIISFLNIITTLGRGNGKIFVYTTSNLTVSTPRKQLNPQNSFNISTTSLSPILEKTLKKNALQQEMNNHKKNDFYDNKNNNFDYGNKNNGNFSIMLKKGVLEEEKMIAEEERKELEELVVKLDEESKNKDFFIEKLSSEKLLVENQNETLRQLLDQAKEQLNNYIEQETDLINGNEEMKDKLRSLESDFQNSLLENKNLKSDLGDKEQQILLATGIYFYFPFKLLVFCFFLFIFL